jgi:hypothetical protein
MHVVIRCWPCTRGPSGALAVLERLSAMKGVIRCGELTGLTDRRDVVLLYAGGEGMGGD